MQKDTKHRLIGSAQIIGATLIWGVSFVILKNTLDTISPLWIMGIRFTAGAVLMFLIGLGKIKLLDRKYALVGLVLGITLFLAYLLQTDGLKYTTPGKNAFLTAAYCVIVPFLGRLVFKTRLNRFNIMAAVICIIGVGFVSLERDFSVNIGDLLTLGCSFFFAVQIIVLDRYVGDMDIRLLSAVQFIVCGIISLILAPIVDGAPGRITAEMLPNFAYICVMCTVVAFMLQCFGQKNTQASEAAVLLSLESVFGTLGSVVFYHEKMTAQLIFGFALIFAAVIITETKLDFLKGKRKKE